MSKRKTVRCIGCQMAAHLPDGSRVGNCQSFQVLSGQPLLCEGDARYGPSDQQVSTSDKRHTR